MRRSGICTECGVSVASLDTYDVCNQCQLDDWIHKELGQSTSRRPQTVKSVRARALEEVEKRVHFLDYTMEEGNEMRRYILNHTDLRFDDAELVPPTPPPPYDFPAQSSQANNTTAVTTAGPCRRCKRQGHEMWFFNVQSIHDDEKRAQKSYTHHCMVCRIEVLLRGAFKKNEKYADPIRIASALRRCAEENSSHWFRHVRDEADASQDDAVKQELLSMLQQLEEAITASIAKQLRRLPSAGQGLHTSSPAHDASGSQQQLLQDVDEADDDLPLRASLERRRQCLSGTEQQSLLSSPNLASTQQGAWMAAAVPAPVPVPAEDRSIIAVMANTVAVSSNSLLPAGDGQTVQGAHTAGDAPVATVPRTTVTEITEPQPSPTDTSSSVPAAGTDATEVIAAAVLTELNRAREVMPPELYQSLLLQIDPGLQWIGWAVTSAITRQEEEQADRARIAERQRLDEEEEERIRREVERRKAAKRQRDEEEDREIQARKAKRQKEEEEITLILPKAPR